jgi:hypothetical protein
MGSSGQELFAEATQVWFGVTKRTDVNKYVSTINEIKQIKNDNISLYDYLKKVYGESEIGKGGTQICNNRGSDGIFNNCDFCEAFVVNPEP